MAVSLGRDTTYLAATPASSPDPHHLKIGQSRAKAPFIIDAGSNIGLSIIYFKSIYPQSRIIAFEPEQKIFDILKQNMLNCQLYDVELHNAAVWTHDTELKFFSEGSLAGSAVTDFNGRVHVTKVKARRLRSFIEQYDQIDFLELDIEGAENHVLF